MPYEDDADKTRAMLPVTPEPTASEKTTKISVDAVKADQEAWPEHEPDAEQPTVQTPVPPPVPQKTQPVAQPPLADEPTRSLAQPVTPQMTQQITPPPAVPDFGSDPTVQHMAPVLPEPEDSGVYGPVMVEPEQDAADAEAKKARKKKALIVAAAAVGALGLLYGLDILISSGNVPRGVTVAGVDVGGMSHTAAESKLREEIEPRLSKPVTAKAGDVDTEIDPKAAGLALDWSKTVDRAGSQPLNPITRITSFFTSREVGYATQADDDKLKAAVEGLRGKTDHEPTEGTIKFEGAKAVAVEPRNGQKLKADEAVSALMADWAEGRTVELPVDSTPVKTTKEGVQKMLDEVATPAVSGPVVVKGEGKDATLTPEQIATTLVFEPGENGDLNVKQDLGKITEAAGPQLKDTEKEGKDAAIVFEGGAPKVKESVDGRGVDWEKSFSKYFDVLKSKDQREIKAEYKHTPAKVTTEQANKMGIKEVIGEFQTGGFAADSGVNIRTVAEKVNGAIVKPKETFSLNGYTGPRGRAQGYVDAGIIENGIPGRAVGGGISQFATTLYNAYYLAGMKDAGHKEHSYWISRYPKGREATVFMDANGNSLIDIRFTNPDDTGVAIQTIWTPSSIKIVLWGTKNYDVSGSTSGEFNPTQPEERKVNKTPCTPSNGAHGFSVTDTRTIKDRRTGEVRSESRTVRYDPSHKIVCETPPPTG